MRACTSCGEDKLPDEFYWTSRRNGERVRHTKCKPCRKRQFKVWRESESGRKWKRKQGYAKLGIDLATYAEMFDSQGGVCAICLGQEKKRRNGRVVALAVDHNHSTGQVRGLLCHKCNSGLGAFCDDLLLVERAASYLQKGNG